MFIKVWEKGKGITTPSKPQKIRIITKGTPPFQNIEFKNIIDGRAYTVGYKNGYFSVILEFKGLKGISDWNSLMDEVDWASEVIGKAETMEVDIPDQITFPVIGLSVLGGLKSLELIRRKR